MENRMDDSVSAHKCLLEVGGRNGGECRVSRRFHRHLVIMAGITINDDESLIIAIIVIGMTIFVDGRRRYRSQWRRRFATEGKLTESRRVGTLHCSHFVELRPASVIVDAQLVMDPDTPRLGGTGL